jgi:beta-ureidopropionase
LKTKSYVVASNHVGKDDDLWFCGSSAIIDPRGVVIAAASADREELIQVETLEDAVKSVRGRMEVFAHRRPDVCR